MVTKWGLSDKLGPLTYSEETGEVFLGRSVTQHKQVSDVTAHAIDEEVRRVIEGNYTRAKAILQSNLDKLHNMADALIKYETIDEEQLKDIMAGKHAQAAEGLGRDAVQQAAAGAAGARRWSADSRGTALTVHAARGSGARLTGVRRTMSPQDPPVQLRCADKTLDLSTPLVMGVLNVTPDSFSDGGRFLPAAAAVAHGLRMAEEGAAIIDVGGESTRPGAGAVSAAEELQRVLPVIERLRAASPAVISVDTSKPEVMRAAAAAGAGLINDVRALRAPGAMAAALESGCAVCLMHMQGEPRTMQLAPVYEDVVAEVRAFLAERAAACRAAGFARRAPRARPRIRLRQDPGAQSGAAARPAGAGRRRPAARGRACRARRCSADSPGAAPDERLARQRRAGGAGGAQRRAHRARARRGRDRRCGAGRRRGEEEVEMAATDISAPTACAAGWASTR